MANRIETFHWNPRKSLIKGRLARYTKLPGRINNFGDLIGPLIVGKILQRLGLSGVGPVVKGRLFSVGSVMHFATDGDVVWGSGVNGKMPVDLHRFVDLDVRAVRGPLTRAFLQERGIEVPEVYGDPALLLPYLLPDLRRWSQSKTHAVTVIPNLNDLAHYPAPSDDDRMLDPCAPMMVCLRRIAESELVVGSSLHGVIVAEALGIPARVVAPAAESPLKYLDYYQGTGRSVYTPAPSIADAVAAGGESGPDFSPIPLVRAFPADLWGLPMPPDVEAVLGAESL